jgi:hypothetical protein
MVKVLSQEEWRTLPRSTERGVQEDHVFVRHYCDAGLRIREKIAILIPNNYTVALTMRDTQLTIFIDGKRVFDGVSRSGEILVNPPDTGVRVYKDSCDVLHVFAS